MKTITAKSKPSFETNGESVADRLSRAIQAGIRDGRFAPGQRLIEADLMQEFGVGRSSLRETLQKSVAEGWLEATHNRGIRVRKQSRPEIAHLYRVREVLEGLAARIAAENISLGGNKAKLQVLSNEMEKLIKKRDSGGYYELNEELHKLIVEIGGNPYLSKLVDQLRIPLFRLQFRTFSQADRTNVSHNDHQVLIKAVLSGDPDSAELAMKQHIKHSAEYLADVPDEYFG